MGKQEFQQSMASGGRHAALQKLLGEWVGTARVWFEPDKLGEEASVRGTIRSVLDGRFVVHEYATTFFGAPNDGIAIIGWHMDAARYEMAWVDAGHSGTAIMFCEGGRDAADVSVLGHYGGHDGGQPWGWRTAIEQPDDDSLIITAWNITPEGEESKATEIAYRRGR
jgi:hypothetical protein